MNSDQQAREWITAQALEWFIAHRSNELTDEKREEFIDWLRASPVHAREYLALTGFSEDLRRIAEGFSVSAEELVAQARADVDNVQPLFPTSSKPSAVRDFDGLTSLGSRFRTWLAAAGVVLAAVALGLFTTWHIQNRAGYSTAHAEQRTWRMPDGSTVHLNSGSQIKVRFDDEHREVELVKGQALFQVAKDSKRPFWVRAGSAVVKAVGTEFDVYRQPARTVISVVEGRVAVWRLRGISAGGAPQSTAGDHADSNQPVAQLHAGEQVRISPEAAVVSRKAADVHKTVAWLHRQIVFDHDSLGTAVDEFNRYGDISIRIDDASVRAAEVSGIFNAYDIDAFVRFLERQPDMHVQRAGDLVVVTASHTQ